MSTLRLLLLTAVLAFACAGTAAAQVPVWSDEFHGSAGQLPDAAKWSFETGGRWGNGTELQYYTDRRENASLDGSGNLAITARRERYAGQEITRDYTSARLTTFGKFEFLYGRVEARIRAPGGKGLLPAFWAMGNDIEQVGWPANGEIDVMEVLGSEQHRLLGSVHGPREGHADYGLTTVSDAVTPWTADFHTYGMTWSPGEITIDVDGRIYARYAPSSLPAGSRWVFDHPFYLLFTLPVGGAWPGDPDATTPFPATMLVDYVRVWDVASMPAAAQSPMTGAKPVAQPVAPAVPPAAPQPTAGRPTPTPAPAPRPTARPVTRTKRAPTARAATARRKKTCRARAAKLRSPTKRNAARRRCARMALTNAHIS
jgi:beta-glucanase (GH16 family)